MAAKKTKTKEETGKDLQGMSIEESFARLEEIIGGLEDEDISLEDSFRLYTEGMELAAACSASIDRVEKQVMILNGDGTLEEFE